MNVVKKFDFTSELGWSVTRYNTFQTCKRQYYYTYYGKYDPEYPRHRIDKLKAMTTVPMETGNIVHDCIKTLLERLLKSEDSIEKDRFLDYSARKTKNYCSSKVFAEMHYGELTCVNPEEVFEKVRTSLDNFILSERFSWLTKEAVHNKTGWIIEPPGYGETRIDGMKAYCKVDFLFPVDDVCYIIDWKTGKQDPVKHKKQLTGYASWACYHLEKEPTEVVPLIAYLFPEYNEIQIEANEFDITEFAGQVKTEIDEMRSYCKDVAENIPTDKERFIKTTYNRICDYCNFRELCE